MGPRSAAVIPPRQCGQNAVATWDAINSIQPAIGEGFHSHRTKLDYQAQNRALVLSGTIASARRPWLPHSASRTARDLLVPHVHDPPSPRQARFGGIRLMWAIRSTKSRQSAMCRQVQLAGLIRSSDRSRCNRWLLHLQSRVSSTRSAAMLRSLIELRAVPRSRSA